MQEPRARHSASSTATATQPARWHRSPRPHEASTNVPHIDRKISTRPFSTYYYYLLRCPGWLAGFSLITFDLSRPRPTPKRANHATRARGTAATRAVGRCKRPVHAHPLAPRVTRSSHAKRVRQASWTRSLRTLGPWVRTWRLGRRTSALARRASWSVGRPMAAAQSWSLPEIGPRGRRRSPHPRAQLPRRASSPPRRWSSTGKGCRAALRLRSWRR